LTSDTDADAGDDEHIKALFHEIDANKDGKVSLVHSCCQTKVFKTSSFCCRGVAPKNCCLPENRTFSMRAKQVDFAEYLGEHDAPAAEAGAGTKDESGAAA
jgi:hypothetical protein